MENSTVNGYNPNDDTAKAELLGKLSIVELLGSMRSYADDGYLWYVYRLVRPTADSALPFTKAGMRPYMPMMTVTTTDGNGNTRTEQKPKLLNYIFVLGTTGQVELLRHDQNPITPLRRHREAGEWDKRMKEYSLLQEAADELQKKLAANERALADMREDTEQHAGKSAETAALKKQLHEIYSRGNTLFISRQWQTVPYAQMSTLIRYTEGHDGEVRIVAADEELLKKGDRVRITGGHMNGMEGILRTSQGRGGGEVFITLTHTTTTEKDGSVKRTPCLGIRSLHIDDRHIKVIEFAPNTTHFYKKICSFEKVLDDAIANYRNGIVADDKIKGKLRFFINRYDGLENLSRVNRIKLSVVCRAACLLLSDPEAAEAYSRQWNTAPALPATAAEYIRKWDSRIKAVI